MVDLDFLLAVCRSQKFNKVLQEVATELFDMLLGVLADQEHLSRVAFTIHVAFKSVLVVALLFLKMSVQRI